MIKKKYNFNDFLRKIVLLFIFFSFNVCYSTDLSIEESNYAASPKKAIVTGITGQDAAYLAEFLLGKGYDVYGTYRRSASTNFWRIDDLGIKDHERLHLVEFDLTDSSNAYRIIQEIKPQEVYSLAAQSFVGVSFSQPIATAQVNAIGPLNLLEAIRHIDPSIRFYQASTSEMYGMVQTVPQNEATPLYPRSPYGVAKQFAHWMTINYRESYGIFASCGILFNHESPLRGLEFVTRKITDGLARVKLGKIPYIELGNLDAKRDWGYSKDYIQAMWLMLQADKADTYVLATGRTETIRHFVELTCKNLNINIKWEGAGVEEIGIDQEKGNTIVKINPKFYRPCEVDLLIGDPSKARSELGWEPTTTLEELSKIMIDADLIRVEKGNSF